MYALVQEQLVLEFVIIGFIERKNSLHFSDKYNLIYVTLFTVIHSFIKYLHFLLCYLFTHFPVAFLIFSPPFSAYSFLFS